LNSASLKRVELLKGASKASNAKLEFLGFGTSEDWNFSERKAPLHSFHSYL